METADNSAINSKGKAKLSTGGCLLRVVTIAMLLGVIAYVVQAWFADHAEPEPTKPVVISGSSTTGAASTDPENDALPEGAITATINQQMIDEAPHPFEPLLKIAQLGSNEVDAKYQDYTTTLISQVRVDGELQEEKHVFCKILHPVTAAGSDTQRPEIPFSVYTKFLAPKATAGQEAIWVEGQNKGKIIGHPPGMLNLKRVPLDPDGALAMKGNLHPIYEIGFRNLLVKMVELGEKDMKHGECSVLLTRGVKINSRACTTIDVIHPQKREHFEHHIARIYIDDELNIPIAYEAFLWPQNAGGDPVLHERYIYTDIKLNVGLTADDFDPGNKEYNFPAW